MDLKVEENRCTNLNKIIKNREIKNIEGKILFLNNNFRIEFSHKVRFYKFCSKTQKLELIKMKKNIKRWITGMILCDCNKITILTQDEFNNYNKIIIKSVSKKIKFKCKYCNEL